MYKIRKEGIIVGTLNILAGLILGTLGILFLIYNKGTLTFKTPLVDILTTWGLLKPILVFVGFEVLFVINIIIGIKSINSATKINPENKVKKSSYILSIILTSARIIISIILAIIFRNLVISKATLCNFCVVLSFTVLAIAIIVLDIKTLAKNKAKKE